MRIGTTVSYEQDGGDETVAIVWHVEDGKVNLAVYNPSDGTWSNANSVPVDDPRIKT